MSRFHQVKAAARHWLHVVDQHSIHSPFFFDFYTKVLKKETDEGKFEKIEEIRKKLLKNTLEINVQDHGSGSSHFKQLKRKLSQIASTGLTPSPFCAFYSRIIQFQGAENIVELGTSLGITTLHLASNIGTRVYTFEGSHEVANVALTNFEYSSASNIELIEGDIDSTLSKFLQSHIKIDFAFIDANHRYEPTIRYFNELCKRMDGKGIIVMDDIHYTSEMERAWNELKDHDLIYGSVDLFRCGLLFFDPALNKQHFVWSL